MKQWIKTKNKKIKDKNDILDEIKIKINQNHLKSK